jgi:type I site-specific restriction endonuclease
MNKKELSERDICTKFITPALRTAGWDEMTQLREEVSFTFKRESESRRSSRCHRRQDGWLLLCGLSRASEDQSSLS